MQSPNQWEKGFEFDQWRFIEWGLGVGIQGLVMKRRDNVVQVEIYYPGKCLSLCSIMTSAPTNHWLADP